jgi:drug/metabolite transporter (DMT)-like permease
MLTWLAFILLGLAWGSSFLWIKIALAEIGPFTLVAFRLLFGALGLLALLWLKRQPLPRAPGLLLLFLFQAVVQTALPFVLISWGEQSIDSAAAAILNGTMPLFTIVIAHFWLRDEKITLPRLGGLILGFAGVVVLVGRGARLGPAAGANFWGQMAVLVATASYALGSTSSRKFLRGQPALLQAAMVVGLSDILLWVAAPIVERPFRLPAAPITWFALVWLGLLGSCLAYILYFHLINAWGATRASVVTYTLPVVGVILGVLFLREAADWRLLLGTALVVGGVAVVNVRPRARAAAASVPAQSGD